MFVVRDLYLRLAAGTYAIALGLALIKIYCARNESTLWGDLYRVCAQMMHWQGTGLLSGKILLVLGGMSILGGIIAIVYGFRIGI